MKKQNKKQSPKVDNEYTVISSVSTPATIAVRPVLFKRLVEVFTQWTIEAKITRGIWQAAVKNITSEKADVIIQRLIKTLVPRVVHELCHKKDIVLTVDDYKHGKTMVLRDFRAECEAQDIDFRKQWQAVATSSYIKTQIIVIYMFPSFADQAFLLNEILRVSQISGQGEGTGMEVLFMAALEEREQLKRREKMLKPTKKQLINGRG